MLLRSLTFGFAVAAAVAVGLDVAPTIAADNLKKHYWATSLSGRVDPALLKQLRAAVRRGETGWLDIDPKLARPVRERGINLVLYHVGGNCYIEADCQRFPSAVTTGTRWDVNERAINLEDARVRQIVVADLLAMVQNADKLMPARSTIGVHVDNVHGLDEGGIAALINDYLEGIDIIKREGLLSQHRAVGYIAKNNPAAFKCALDRRLIETRPLYQIVENARLDASGALDPQSQIAQEFGQQYGIPVFLKTFGSDLAYRTVRDGQIVDVYVSPEMTERMAQMPHIAGAAWSADEGNYHPTLFAQGSPVRETPLLVGAGD
jgi:hypothetical protein